MKTGDRIKQRRLELGLSVDELAQLLHKNRATVYRYESSEIENFPVSVLEPLAKALCTTPEYLMGWSAQAAPSVGQSAISRGKAYLLDAREGEVIEAYRSQPEMRPAVDRLLGLSTRQKPHLMPIAAHNDNAADAEEQALMREDLDEL